MEFRTPLPLPLKTAWSYYVDLYQIRQNVYNQLVV